MKKIIKENTKKEIIEKIGSQNEVLDYEVGENASLLLVLLAKPNSAQSVAVNARLLGRGAHADIRGIIVGEGKSDIAINTLQEHMAPETTSNLLVKSVLSDQAQFRYDGGIRVEKKAQKTDAYQRNENLLLSREAHAESKPSLEILANDVRCTHGSTTGTLAKDQLWYLATRGVTTNDAKKLLVDGFLTSTFFTISATMQQEIRRYLWETV